VQAEKTKRAEASSWVEEMKSVVVVGHGQGLFQMVSMDTVGGPQGKTDWY